MAVVIVGLVIMVVPRFGSTHGISIVVLVVVVVVPLGSRSVHRACVWCLRVQLRNFNGPDSMTRLD